MRETREARRKSRTDLSRLPPRSALDGRHRRPAPQRHAAGRRLRAHLVAKSYRTLTKKSGTAEAIPDFFVQGQKDLVSAPLRSARSLRATGTHSPLDTRFWSGCGKGALGNGEGPVLPGSPEQVPKECAGLWCSHQILQPFDFHFGLRIDSRLAGKIPGTTFPSERTIFRLQ